LALVSPYLAQAKSVEELAALALPEGIFPQGIFKRSAAALLGLIAEGLSSHRHHRSEGGLWEEYEAWRKRDLHG